MADTSKMVFDSIKRIEVEVVIEGQEYLLFEANVSTMTDYNNAILNGTILSEGKPVKMIGFASIDTLLLCRCLYDVKLGQYVKESVVNNWPNRIKRQLVERCKEISGITDEDEVDQSGVEQELGNSSNGTMDGSD